MCGSQNACVYIPDDLRMKIPPLHATENDPNAVAWVRFFTPGSSWAWYVMEYDGEDTCFGCVVGETSEMAYFALSGIDRACRRLGLSVERDQSFQPVPLAKARGGEVAHFLRKRDKAYIRVAALKARAKRGRR